MRKFLASALFLFLSLATGCGEKPKQPIAQAEEVKPAAAPEAAKEKKADAKADFPEVTAKELETIGETFVGKQVTMRGLFVEVTDTFISNNFDKDKFMGFEIYDKKAIFFIILLLQNLYTQSHFWS